MAWRSAEDAADRRVAPELADMLLQDRTEERRNQRMRLAERKIDRRRSGLDARQERGEARERRGDEMRRAG